ncbi:hypothetical protein HDU98_007929 [Podochytrium sp. JEL0797]|nr:hypothetical protein HDU98_007929 [Podochytrium sp. JEL0797]
MSESVAASPPFDPPVERLGDQPFDASSLLLVVQTTHSATQTRLQELAGDIGALHRRLAEDILAKVSLMHNEAAFEFNKSVAEIQNMASLETQAEAKLQSFYAALMNSFAEFFDQAAPTQDQVADEGPVAEELRGIGESGSA